MKFALVTRAIVIAGALAFAGAASAASVTVGVEPPPVVHEHSGAVVVEHDHPTVIEHRSATDCSSKKTVVHHGNGSTSVHKRTDCGD